MSRVAKSYIYNTQRLLAQIISNNHEDGKFLQEIACVNFEEKLDIAYAKSYLHFVKNNKGNMDFEEFLLKIAIPITKTIGLAKWRPTELTELGFKVGAKGEEEELNSYDEMFNALESDEKE